MPNDKIGMRGQSAACQGRERIFAMAGLPLENVAGHPFLSERRMQSILAGYGLRATRQRIGLIKLLFGGGNRHVTADVLAAEAQAVRMPMSLRQSIMFSIFSPKSGLCAAYRSKPGVWCSTPIRRIIVISFSKIRAEFQTFPLMPFVWPSMSRRRRAMKSRKSMSWCGFGRSPRPLRRPAWKFALE